MMIQKITGNTESGLKIRTLTTNCRDGNARIRIMFMDKANPNHPRTSNG